MMAWYDAASKRKPAELAGLDGMAGWKRGTLPAAAGDSLKLDTVEAPKSISLELWGTGACSGQQWAGSASSSCCRHLEQWERIYLARVGGFWQVGQVLLPSLLH